MSNLHDKDMKLGCTSKYFQSTLDRPHVAQWLEYPLGVREAGVRSPTASHQRR